PVLPRPRQQWTALSDQLHLALVAAVQGGSDAQVRRGRRLLRRVPLPVVQRSPPRLLQLEVPGGCLGGIGRARALRRLHPAVPEGGSRQGLPAGERRGRAGAHRRSPAGRDRKSTRLNSSHSQISYAVFCLKKTKEILP